ncbi:MAG TPA: long-chain-fatty-acid--CoA ligase [Blastocatellia bacterium]|nr:long-chain-fatty-acid--CoA ligase [Blastocatellia bacterium]
MPASPSNIGALLEAQVERTPDKEFLLLEFGDRVFTYRQFDDEVNRAAAVLTAVGVARGDRVSLLLVNRAEYLIFYFACFKIGAWAGPVNALLKPREIEFVIADSEAGTVVTQPDMLPHLDTTRAHAASFRNVIVVGDDDKWTVIDNLNDSINEKRLVAPNPQLQTTNPELNLDDEAVIIYTSGTAGKPKGVLLTHGNLLSNARQIAEWLALTPEDRSLILMPLFHVNALMTTTMAALWAGGSIVLAPRFSASHHWETVSRHGVTYFGSVATMLSILNHAYSGGLPAGLDLSRFRFALCGSAPVPIEVLKTFESLFKFPVIEGYGLSESTCRATFNPIDDRRAGSVGKPIGNEVRVFDENEQQVGPHQVGEIVLRGPNIMKSYYKNATATREAFLSGWFHTGDLGYRDEDGFFYVVDRKSDMIIRAGENIYPREIDEVLYQHPKVRDAATIGVPHELYGEEVKSFVVPREGQEITEQEIIEFCSERLADFKCPKTVEFVEDIPKGPTGKLLKRELMK